MRQDLHDAPPPAASTEPSLAPPTDARANGRPPAAPPPLPPPPRRATTRSRALLRGAIYGGVLLAAVGVAFVATREPAAPPSGGATAHQHGAAASSGGGDVPRSVMLLPAQERRIGVTYAAATLGPLEKQVRTVGQVTFDETRVRAISPKVDGWVDRLFVNATGQPVRVGQPLLAIYSPMLVSAEEELLLATRLRRDVAAGSADARDGADDLLASARRRLAYWDVPASEIAAVERSGQVRKTLTLVSPAEGYVLEKNVVAGQKVMAGDALYRVADLSTVWVEGQVFEQDLADVRVGQQVHADFQALPGEHRMGRIAYVYPTLDAETRTAKVRVVMANPGLRLKPGMYATIRIVGTARPDVLTVPRDAVLSTGERNIVFVRDASGRLSAREVALGVATDDRVEVLRGLTAGETVVASATFLVDAESNLGKALGGMGDMPGMDMSTPPKPLPMDSGSRPSALGSRPSSGRAP